MKLTVQTISQPAEGQLDLTLRFSDLDPATALKVANLGQVVQAAAADGKVSFTEEIMVGLALGALFQK